jgi:hypothetical protein
LEEPRLYTLNLNGHYDFHTGSIKDGLQVLASHYHPLLLIIVFDQDGNLKEVLERNFVEEGVPVRDDKALLQQWLGSMGFEEAPIIVREFFLPDKKIGVRELTDGMYDFLNDPSQFSEVEAENYQQWIPGWKASKEFVFWWHQDFWCDAEGYIIAT